MKSVPVVDDDMITRTVQEIAGRDFTVLDFQEPFRRLYLAQWSLLIGKYGTYGEGRYYTVSNYLAHRIQQFSWKDQNVLLPHTPWTVDRAKDFREPTPSEKDLTGARILAVFR